MAGRSVAQNSSNAYFFVSSRVYISVPTRLVEGKEEEREGDGREGKDERKLYKVFGKRMKVK